MEGKTITYRQQKSFCNKPSCRKCREGSGHGPYWYAYQVVNGRTMRTYIGKVLPPNAQLEQIEATVPSSPTLRWRTAVQAAPTSDIPLDHETTSQQGGALPAQPRSQQKPSKAHPTRSGTGQARTPSKSKRSGTPPAALDEGAKAPRMHRTHAAEEAEPMTSEVPIGRSNQSPLVGRDRELTTLHQLLMQVESKKQHGTATALSTATQRPRARFLVLMGELGIGKTRLAEEAARSAQRRGWTVIWSRAYPQEQSMPYRLWTTMLRSVLSNTPDLLQQKVSASIATYQPLRILIPEMQERLVGAGIRSLPDTRAYEALSPEQEELRLRDAIYTFLTTLNLSSPLLLILDDIQWIDESSAQMLGYLARRMTGHPIVLLTTCRETDLAANRVLHDLLSHMQREHTVEFLHVQPLSHEQIGELVSYLPAPAISQVQRQAEGNPFFAEELGYSLRTNTVALTPTPAETQEDAQTLPSTITAALDRRLSSLTKDCQDLLGKVAVLGGSFDFDLLLKMEAGSAADDEETLFTLLEEALSARILTEEGTTYHFRHPLLANHLYHGLSAIRRARLHRRAADVLSRIYSTHDSEEAAAITRHLVRGGAEPARIAQYGEIAANHAYTIFAYPEAERYYRITLQRLAPALLDPHTQALPGELAAQTLAQRLHLALLVERMAECARILGNFQDARNLYTRALHLRATPSRTFATSAEEHLEAQIQAMLWTEIAWTWRYTGDTNKARTCNAQGEEVLRTAGITGGPAWASLLVAQASLYWQEGYHQEALQAAQQALEVFTSSRSEQTVEQINIPTHEHTRIRRILLGDPINLGRTHNFLGIAFMLMGQFNHALEHLHQALVINDQYERRRESANVYCNTGHIHLLRGEYALAQDFFQRALAYAEQSHDIPVKSITLCNFAEMAAEMQQSDKAEMLYRESLALAEQINDREYLSTWHVLLARLYQDQHRFQEAATAILRALAIGRAMPNQPCISTALIALTNLRLALVEHAPNATSAQKQRALRHAETDLRRALSLRGLDAERRTQAQLAEARLSFLQGAHERARQQGLEAYAAAQHYELNALQTRCQKFLASFPEQKPR